jgi:hypothetical protein
VYEQICQGASENTVSTTLLDYCPSWDAPELWNNTNGVLSLNSLQYDNSMYCAWRIENPSPPTLECPPGIMIRFDMLNIETGYDYIYVFDGPDTAAPLLGMYTGTDLPMNLYSTQSQVVVLFYSDYSITLSGFMLYYELSCVGQEFITDITPYVCSPRSAPSEFSDNEGSISLLTHEYDNNMDCYWLLANPAPATADCDPALRVRFSFLDLESSRDYLIIYDGGDSTAAPTFFTGNVLPDRILSSGSQLLLRLLTDSQNTASGFVLYYEQVCREPVTQPVCPEPADPWVFHDDSGFVSISGSEYMDSMNCGWRVTNNNAATTSCNPGVLVTLTFLAIQDGFDYLQIHDGPSVTDPVIGSYTGSPDSTSVQLYSSSHSIFIQFTTDGSVTLSGFTVAFERTCVAFLCPSPGSPAISFPELSSLAMVDEAAFSGDCGWSLHNQRYLYEVRFFCH